MEEYILLKDTPELKAGADFKYEETNCVYVHINPYVYYHRKTVEDNPEWFRKEEYGLTGFKFALYNHDMKYYVQDKENVSITHELFSKEDMIDFGKRMRLKALSEKEGKEIYDGGCTEIFVGAEFKWWLENKK